MTRLRRWYRGAATAVVLALVVAAAVGLASIGSIKASAPIRTYSQFIPGTPEGNRPVRLDTTIYLPASTPAPAVLLAHGFGATKDSLDGEARDLARAGFLVLAYTARGFGRSGGLIHLDAPDYEVHDAHLLVSYLAELPQVARRDGRPQIAVAGASYGGALALLLAGTDHRIVAVGADITWNDLAAALFPNDAGPAPGVFKKFWATTLFAAGLPPGGSNGCGRYAPAACQAFQYAAATGMANGPLLALLRAASPSRVLGQITAPVLLTQGEQDSLFGLDQALANARGIAAHGTPVRMVWRLGGHDEHGVGDGPMIDQLVAFLRDAFAGRVRGPQPWRIEQPDGAGGTSTLGVAGIPGVDGWTQPHTTVTVAGPPQPILAPAGGSPAAVTALPQLSALLGATGQLPGASALSAVPGQIATFVSAPLRRSALIAGSATVRLRVTSAVAGDATLFAALRDVTGSGPGSGSVLPDNLVAPLLVTGLRPGVPRPVTVHLPAIVHDVPAGHRLALTVGTTDLAYQLPTDPRTYTIALAGGAAAAVTVPTVHASARPAPLPWSWLITGGAVAVALALAVGFELHRRRRRLRPDTTLAGVPVALTGLAKEYGDGFRAVDGVSFRVEAGQVVGLLGRNGAGKTTVLRMLVGLITPTAGAIRVFGAAVVPGASVLTRVGALIEGPGFLPHLSGRENLRLYWAASGRPAHEAHLDEALHIAGLGAAVERPVRKYSHGMRQRLGIAQAMLGLPDLLVLDEPTDGLDPPQIAEMREVLQRYAASGRTVLVSSHLLAEVEQTCTHVVVLHRGKLVAAGSVADVVGAGDGGRVQLVVDNPRRAVAVLAASGIGVREVAAHRALEDVFLGLTGEGPTGEDVP